MSLHSAKRTAILHVTNCVATAGLKDMTELATGERICDIINTVFPETRSKFEMQEKQNSLNFEEKSKNKKESRALKKYEDSIKKDSEDVPESVMEPAKSTDDACGSFIKAAKSVDIGSKIEVAPCIDNDSESIKAVKSTGSDSESVIKAAKSAEGDNEYAVELAKSAEDNKSVTELIKFADDHNDEAHRYKFIQYFINERYKLQSELLISYTACRKSNELELAKVAIFILSEVVKHYVLNNNELIKTLSHLDTRVQQDLEQCFTFFINERSKITKKDITRILCSHASYKATSPQNRSFLNTPRRSCSSKYRKSVSPATPSNEDVYTNSPLKSYFESPIFKKEDIISKEKENFKTRQNLYEEELKSEDLQLQLNELKEKLRQKDKKICNLKSNIRMLEEDKLEESQRCKDYMNKLEDCKRNIQRLQMKISEVKQMHEKDHNIYLIEVTRLRGELQYLHSMKKPKSLGKDEDVTVILKKKNNVIRDLEEKIKLSEEQNEELQNEVKEWKGYYEVCKEELSEAKANLKQKPESPVVGEIIGSVIQEENMSLRMKPDKADLQIKERTEEIDRKIEKCMEQKLDCVKYESDVSRPELLPETKKNQNLKKHGKTAEEECSEVADVSGASSNLNITSKHLASSISTEVSCTENAIAPVTSDTLGSLWAQYDPGLDNENCEGTLSMDNGLTKALNTYKELQEFSAELDVLITFYLQKSPLASNGSNGYSDLQVIITKLRDISCIIKSLPSLPAGESQVKLRNNNSTSKDHVMLDKCEYNCGSSYSKSVKHLKLENDKRNSKTPKSSQNYIVALKKISDLEKILEKKGEKINELEKTLKKKDEKINELEKDYKEASKSLQDKICKQEEMNEKLVKLTHENNRCKRECANLELKRNNMAGKYNNMKIEKSKLKEDLEEMSKREEKLVNRCKQRSDLLQRNYEEVCKRARKEKQLLKNTMEFLSSRIKLLELKGKEDNCPGNVNFFSMNTIEENKVLPSAEGIKDNYKHVEESTNSGFSESEFISQNADNQLQNRCNESTLSSALNNKSMHSVLHLHTDDEESFLNYSSISEIKKGYESSDSHKIDRLKELHRRNTMNSRNLQSSYSVELNCWTPLKVYEPFRYNGRDIYNVKADDKWESNEHAGKKRKVRENESELQPSKLLATPCGKVKTPNRSKWFDFHRNRRHGFIRPKP